MFSTGEKTQTRKQAKQTNPPLLYCEEKSEFVVLGIQALLTAILVKIQSVLKAWIVGL